MLEWAYIGVNSSVPGNGGPACANYLRRDVRISESVGALIWAGWLIKCGYSKIMLPEKYAYVRKDRAGKRILLVLMSLIWGIEIGFKFSSRTVIYLLNPCHIVTAMQIFLLAAPPSKIVTIIFRLHLNFLNGPVLAFLFPVTESRILPFEVHVYWIQHTMMMVVPYYLFRLGGVYNVERLRDISWCCLAYGLILLYHFIILQAFALPAQVNLNHMLCPAASDPFAGPFYRTSAVVHQNILCPLVCKLYCATAGFFLTKFGPTKVKSNLSTDVSLSLHTLLGPSESAAGAARISNAKEFSRSHRRSRSEQNGVLKVSHLHED